MRQLVTGVDADGRSCIVSEHITEPSHDIAIQTPFETTASPPPRPPGSRELYDMGLPVGAIRVLVVQWPPGFQASMHHTDTIDVNTVTEGSVDLVLDDGPHTLEAGDSVIVTGVDHGWLAGPDGATVTGVLLGTMPPA
jgi:quercetin dioxygenase-like cupin family protein